jgi:hypothetical protein
MCVNTFWVRAPEEAARAPPARVARVVCRLWCDGFFCDATRRCIWGELLLRSVLAREHTTCASHGINRSKHHTHCHYFVSTSHQLPSVRVSSCECELCVLCAFKKNNGVKKGGTGGGAAAGCCIGIRFGILNLAQVLNSLACLRYSYHTHFRPSFLVRGVLARFAGRPTHCKAHGPRQADEERQAAKGVQTRQGKGGARAAQPQGRKAASTVP